MTVSPQLTERLRKPHWSLARTWLLQPGIPDGEAAYDAAVAGAADAVVLDIEDGLPDAQKAAGRQSVAGWLDGGNSAWVRINGVGTPGWSADLAALSDVSGLTGVMLAKAESPTTSPRRPPGCPPARRWWRWSSRRWAWRRSRRSRGRPGAHELRSAWATSDATPA